MGVDAGSGFGLDHLPYGVVLIDGEPRPVVRFGDQVLDLRRCAREGLLPDGEWTEGTNLDGLIAAEAAQWALTRETLVGLLRADGRSPSAAALVPLDQVGPPLLPFTVGDYVDFYSSIHHASNVGRLFRPDADPLLPNWRHLPVGYHGRSSTVVVDGTGVRRPIGQTRPGEDDLVAPVGPSSRLDFELEMGFVTGGAATALGQRLEGSQAAQRIFGIVLLNDWSARDIQAWEYQPLGPFLGKSFATSIAGWVTPLAALEAVRVPSPVQEPPVADYLQVHGDWALDLTLEVVLEPQGGTGQEVITRVSLADMYWTMPQQLAHATVNGAVLRPGDLFGSGTVSGPERGTEGSLLEMSLGGQQPVAVAGVSRTFLQDGDIVTLRGHGRGTAGGRLQLGQVQGQVLPAL